MKVNVIDSIKLIVWQPWTDGFICQTAKMENEQPGADWFLFEMPVGALLAYIERCTARPWTFKTDSGEANKWHLALRSGMQRHLHLNVGIPGIHAPPDPVEENPAALHAALLLGKSHIQVILSGEWEIAVTEGLIKRDQLRIKEAAMLATMGSG